MSVKEWGSCKCKVYVKIYDICRISLNNHILSGFVSYVLSKFDLKILKKFVLPQGFSARGHYSQTIKNFCKLLDIFK